ncbi:MAG: ankyrin repeat domain-containing protein [Planctomycetes bacterium]|nr:ankyrin repeat domain-containing protein [Planctomycetota bacterium]
MDYTCLSDGAEPRTISADVVSPWDAISAAHAAPIHTAAREGDVDKVRELLDQGEDINRNSRNGAPLHVAILADRRDNRAEELQLMFSLPYNEDWRSKLGLEQ